VGVLGSTDGADWSNWSLAEGQGVVMPLDDAGEEDTWPVGFALDYTSTLGPPSSTPDNPPIPPCPVLLILNNVGSILAYYCVNKDAVGNEKTCPQMTSPIAFSDEVSIDSHFNSPATNTRQ
jgi:hypothetical protein